MAVVRSEKTPLMISLEVKHTAAIAEELTIAIF